MDTSPTTLAETSPAWSLLGKLGAHGSGRQENGNSTGGGRPRKRGYPRRRSSWIDETGSGYGAPSYGNPKEKTAMGADEKLDEVRIGEVANELEAAMVVNLLNEDGIPARS